MAQAVAQAANGKQSCEASGAVHARVSPKVDSLRTLLPSTSWW